MRCRRVFVAAVLLACAAPVQALARGPSPRAAARIRASLLKQVRHDPAVVAQPWFLRRAGLVKFALPVTLRVRPDGAPTATADLGPSLGARTIALGGALAARVLFSDDFDGGPMGNVGLQIVPSDTRFLTTSAVPLLWNADTSDPATRADANLAATEGIDGLHQGCGDFTSAGTQGDGYNTLFHGLAQEQPGYPFYGAGPDPAGYLPIYPGVDAVDRLHSGAVVGDNDWLGPAQHPFPDAMTDVRDTVLRTNALQLQVAPQGTAFDQGVIGPSGGQANLFGNLPGRGVGVDVTLSLTTQINAVERIVDQDAFGVPLQAGEHYPAPLLQCHQVWTGAVRNYLPAIHLEGQLRIAPAITSDGHLRIAKATVASPADGPVRVALSACLIPAMTYAAAGAGGPTVPATEDGALIRVGSAELATDDATERYAPASALGAGAPTRTPCNTTPDALLRGAPLTPPAGDAAQNGAQVTVAGDITVNPTTVDVIVGQEG